MPDSSIFDSAREKIVRAKRHTAEFYSWQEAFLKKERCEVVTETHSTSGSKIIKIKFQHRIPLDIASIVSDATNNLRDSLDQMGYAAAIASGKGRPGQACFPFADSASALEGSIKRRSKDVPAEILSVFRAFKPYRGGNDTLYALNTIANANKHRMLHPMAISSGGFSLKIGKVSGGAFIIPGNDIYWDGTKNEIILAIYQKGVQVDYDFQVQVYIVFDKRALDDGSPAGEILNCFIIEVERVLAEVEAKSRDIGLVT